VGASGLALDDSELVLGTSRLEPTPQARLEPARGSAGGITKGL